MPSLESMRESMHNKQTMESSLNCNSLKTTQRIAKDQFPLDLNKNVPLQSISGVHQSQGPQRLVEDCLQESLVVRTPQFQQYQLPQPNNMRLYPRTQPPPPHLHIQLQRQRQRQSQPQLGGKADCDPSVENNRLAPRDYRPLPFDPIQKRSAK